MDHVTEYYIVPVDLYNKIQNKQESSEDLIRKVPKTARSKIRAFLQYLKGKEIDKLNLSYPVFNYANYAVRGKFKPDDWNLLASSILDANIKWFSEKVKREIKQLRRKNGIVHKKSLD